MSQREEAAALRAQGMVQREIADRLGISQSRVSQLLLGRTGNEAKKQATASPTVSSSTVTSSTANSQAALREQVRAEVTAELKAKVGKAYDAQRDRINAQERRIAELEEQLRELEVENGRLKRAAGGYEGISVDDWEPA
jgi:predicted transcriptional regulator